jgi:hypothetical protein
LILFCKLVFFFSGFCPIYMLFLRAENALSAFLGTASGWRAGNHGKSLLTVFW